MGFISHYFHVGFLGAFLCYGVAVIVGLTRIYIGVHYPRDVLAGATLGALWVTILALLDPYLIFRPF
jgi:membrane-associated phospholipid phosphatase